MITFHAVFNLLVNQTGPLFWIGGAVPLMAVLAYLIFLRGKIELS